MILLTNDDGIEAPGLERARRVLDDLGEEVLVVAPARGMSQCGHSITTNTALRWEQKGELSFAIEGTPAEQARKTAVPQG